ncbi:hypothetical protein [Amycolatopsis thermoflava]|uniref:hypothetical protein n=1 Tax=Amycolatopsis thermoflava TaxID=84480 RepID=UPI00364A0546
MWTDRVGARRVILIGLALAAVAAPAWFNSAYMVVYFVGGSLGTAAGAAAVAALAAAGSRAGSCC